MTEDTAGTRIIDDDALDRLRPLSFAVAYRMLGSVAEAEDVVQEALLKVAQQADEPGGVRNPDAFVTTVTTRLSINVLRSARARRETYVGPWLPEPLMDATAVAHAAPAPDAAAHAELADDLSTAFLVVLETLTPTERAAFLLHDVLGYPHGEAAEIIGTTAVSARQLASRARRRIEAKRSEALGRTHARRDREEANRLVGRFLAAIEEGKVEAFVDVLADDVVFTGDGGGNVPPGFAISKPMSGRERVAKLLTGFTRRGMSGLAYYVPEDINGAPGLVIMASDDLGGGVLGTLSFEIGTTADGSARIAAAHGVVNPAKLGHLGRLADLDRIAAYVRGGR
ncbi:sigma-70 family RNA polymerase sigma factor [Myceligenerans pegani]|uniref:Sigma-70 family RNA polymerase sigma factor n=1 Tax=Myceligenerans pegani TaxID=2776917 RepID=A0ABR9N3I8_9MICO|nr:sigma-70 family RNA polymerase sigma factor [Myceligenerans sp. TRM 65318]MBE1878217.1 sigma-70 family RNA polymerase sigma factor [Myceligenerans sp. TRM 65318]MBE3020488.1 sigma-70 family RNA polymerase sigma factor [Myceligenerans sp. TRM 65318]